MKTLSRRSVLKTAAFASTSLTMPFVRGAHAAGKLSVAIWDHWVPGANGPGTAFSRRPRDAPRRATHSGCPLGQLPTRSIGLARCSPATARIWSMRRETSRSSRTPSDKSSPGFAPVLCRCKGRDKRDRARRRRRENDVADGRCRTTAGVVRRREVGGVVDHGRGVPLSTSFVPPN